MMGSMTRARSIFQAANLLAKSRNRDPFKWTEIFKGLHRKAFLLTIANGDVVDTNVNICTTREISLVFEAFSRISKCTKLVELNISQKIANNYGSLANFDESGNRRYNEYTFGFYDLVNLYLPLTLKCVDHLNIHDIYKLLSFLKALGQESYLIYNTLDKLSEKFTNECNSLSTSQICQLLKIFTGQLEQTQSFTQIIMPLINTLRSNIMSLNTNQLYEIIEILYLIREIPCNQILYDCYIRLREDYHHLSLKQITLIISCYSRHYKHTHVYIPSLMHQISDFLMKKCSAKLNDKQFFLNAIDARVLCQLFKSYSTIGYIYRPLFDMLFEILHVWSDKLSLIHYSTIAASLASLQTKHNVYLYNYTDLKFKDTHSSQRNALPETYTSLSKDKIHCNPIRHWLHVKDKLQLKSKHEDCIVYTRNKFDEKNEMKAVILIPKENYSSNFICWWRHLLIHLSSHIENLKTKKKKADIDFANVSIEILDSMAKSGQSHAQVVSQLLNFIYYEIDTLSGITVLSLLCNLQSLQINYSELLEMVATKRFNEFTIPQSLICINLILANCIPLQEQHMDFLHKISTQITCNSNAKNLLEFSHPSTLIDIAGHLSISNLNDRNICQALINIVKTNLFSTICPWFEELVNSSISKFNLQLLPHEDNYVNNNLIYSKLRTGGKFHSLSKIKLPTIVIRDNYEHKAPTTTIIPYHWELESFKKSLYRIQLEFSRHNITYISKCTINSCPIDILYSIPENETDKFVILCLAPDEFDTPTANYTHTCYWKTRLAYLNTMGFEIKILLCGNICDDFFTKINDAGNDVLPSL